MSTNADRPLSPFATATDRPVFIGAAPRSGTTLLRLMLNAAPELGIPRETKVLVTAWDERRSFGDLRVEANRRRLADRLVESLPSATSRRLGRPPAELHERIMAAPPTLGSIVGTCLASYADRYNKPRWGDKRPVYSRYLDSVFSMFPDAQFIHVVRDPRAAVASMAQMWYSGRVGPGLELWERSMRAVEPWRARLAPDQFYEFRYEDLIEDPKGVLKRLATFLTVDVDSVEAMLRYHAHGDETSPVHPDVKKPPQKSNVDKWRSALEMPETALIEQVTGEWLDRYDYDRVAAAVSPSKSALTGYQKRAESVAAERRACQREELRALVTRHRPVEAQLTSSQLAGARPPKLPPLRQRWIGRPA
jgi:LPS sulfotransferase NodH